MTFNLYLAIDIIYSIAMVLTPILGYVPQYRLMNKNRSVGAFSKLVCYFLIISNVMRVIFWFGESYRFTIFLQSITILTLQVYLLRKCYEIEKEGGINKNKEKEFSIYHNNNTMPFTLLSHIFAFFCIYMAVFSYLDNMIVIQITGSVSAFFESFIAVPQFVNNLRSKSVKSLR